MMNLIKPFIGAGILALPHAFRTGGIVASSILLGILAFVTAYCMHLLLACSEKIVGKQDRRQDYHVVLDDR